MVPGTGRSPDGTPPPDLENASMIGDESTSDRLRIELAAEAPSAKRARRFVERELTSWKCVELVEVTVLLANELVTNSVLHAHSDIRLEVTKAPDGRPGGG